MSEYEGDASRAYSEAAGGLNSLYGEFISAEREIEAKNEAIKELNKQLSSALKQRGEACEVLEFYAATESWDSVETEDGLIDKSDLHAPWREQGIKVGGKRAREFLASIKKEGEV